MKKRTLWLGLSFLLVAALVLTGCPASVEEEEEEVGVPILGIGETYQTPEVEVTVSEAIVTESYEYYDQASESMATREADPGMSFLIVTAETKNVSSALRREGHGRFFVWTAEGVLKASGAYLGEDVFPGQHGLSAGAKVEGTILFEIREGARDLAISYSSTFGFYWPLVKWVIE